MNKIQLARLGFTSFALLRAKFVAMARTTAINLDQDDIFLLNGITVAGLMAADFILG